MNKKTAIPNALDYSDYRKFLKDYFAYRKKTERSFSYRMFAIKLGKNYHTNIQRVLKGTISLSGHMAEKYIKAMRLGSIEADHFRVLVNMNKPTRVRYSRDEDSALVDMMIYTLSNLDSFKPDPKYINTITKGMVSVKDARESLDYLIGSKLLQKVKGEWAARPKVLVNKRGKDADEEGKMKKQHSKQINSFYVKSGEPKRHFWGSYVLSNEQGEEIMREVTQILHKKAIDAQEKVENMDNVVCMSLFFHPLTSK